MTEKSEWQKANRELIAEDRQRLGDPPTAEEMFAFSRGELPESEEERIRDLLVAYPELARMWAEAAPEAPRPGEPDFVPEEQVSARWKALQQRLRRGPEVVPAVRGEAQRGRVLFHHLPTAIAAVLALVCFGLFVQAEGRARYYAQQNDLPRMLNAPQELYPDGSRGSGAPTTLRRDGEVYLLKPHIGGQIRYPHYQIELRDAKGVVLWTNRNAEPDETDAFQIVVPHTFLQPGETYQLRILGVDGEDPAPIGTYDLRAPAE